MCIDACRISLAPLRLPAVIASCQLPARTHARFPRATEADRPDPDSQSSCLIGMLAAVGELADWTAVLIWMQYQPRPDLRPCWESGYPCTPRGDRRHACDLSGGGGVKLTSKRDSLYCTTALACLTTTLARIFGRRARCIAHLQDPRPMYTVSLAQRWRGRGRDPDT